MNMVDTRNSYKTALHQNGRKNGPNLSPLLDRLVKFCDARLRLQSLTILGDGKSTVIKMLIGLQTAANGASRDEFATPVVGGVGTSIPTSADIHLYADPDSQYTQFPRIYADCEGLKGGESVPMANRAIEALVPETKRKAPAYSEDGYQRKMRGKKQGAKRRKLGFANTDDKRKREYSVRELYPRLLYTFSHVVVFVLHNERCDNPFQLSALFLTNSLLVVLLNPVASSAC